MIEQLVWQWFLEARGWMLEAGAKNSGQRTVNGGQRENQQQVPHTAAFVHVPLSRQTGRPVRNDNAKSKAASSSGSSYGLTGIRGVDRRTPNRPWAKVRVARFLGVSHTWVNKLVKKFEADPERMRRKMRAFAPANIDKLERAREETRWEREHGRLREPIRYRRVKVTIQGKKTRVMAATRVERQRRQAEIDEQRAWLRGHKGVPTLCTERKGWGTQPVAYRDVPEWAKGLPGLSDLGIASAPAPHGRTPRPVRFVFRRRR